MNKYESVIIVTNKIDEKKRKATVSKMENFIKKNGTLEETEDMGIRKLAYPIKKNTEAYYYIFNFETDGENIAELERLYRITDEIIKFIVVRKD